MKKIIMILMAIVLIAGCDIVTETIQAGSFGASPEEQVIFEYYNNINLYEDIRDSGSPEILDVFLSSEIIDYKPLDLVTVFTPDSKSMNAFIVYNNFKDGDEFIVTWTYLTNGAVIANLDATASGDAGRLTSKLEMPDGGWPLGEYELLVEGEGVSQKVIFEVFENPKVYSVPWSNEDYGQYIANVKTTDAMEINSRRSPVLLKYKIGDEIVDIQKNINMDEDESILTENQFLDFETGTLSFDEGDIIIKGRTFEGDAKIFKSEISYTSMTESPGAGVVLFEGNWNIGDNFWAVTTDGNTFKLRIDRSGINVGPSFGQDFTPFDVRVIEYEQIFDNNLANFVDGGSKVTTVDSNYKIATIPDVHGNRGNTFLDLETGQIGPVGDLAVNTYLDIIAENGAMLKEFSSNFESANRAKDHTNTYDNTDYQGAISSQDVGKNYFVRSRTGVYYKMTITGKSSPGSASGWLRIKYAPVEEPTVGYVSRAASLTKNPFDDEFEFEIGDGFCNENNETCVSSPDDCACLSDQLCLEDEYNGKKIEKCFNVPAQLSGKTGYLVVGGGHGNHHTFDLTKKSAAFNTFRGDIFAEPYYDDYDKIALHFQCPQDPFLPCAGFVEETDLSYDDMLVPPSNGYDDFISVGGDPIIDVGTKMWLSLISGKKAKVEFTNIYSNKVRFGPDPGDYYIKKVVHFKYNIFEV